MSLTVHARRKAAAPDDDDAWQTPAPPYSEHAGFESWRTAVWVRRQWRGSVWGFCLLWRLGTCTRRTKRSPSWTQRSGGSSTPWLPSWTSYSPRASTS